MRTGFSQLSNEFYPKWGIARPPQQQKPTQEGSYIESVNLVYAPSV